MSARAGQNFLLGALVVSVVAHVAVMLAMRSQVMTVSFGSSARATRHAMVMRQEKARQPAAVRLVDAPDLAPLKDAPAAASEALVPSLVTLPEADLEGVTMPIPETPMDFEGPQPEREVAPKLFEKMAVSEDLPSYVTPLAADAPLGLTPPAAPPAPEVPAVDPLATDIESPEVRAEPPAPEAEETPEMIADTPAEASDFTPPEEVMDEIDERIVAAEKSAVRALLDTGAPRELSKYVAVSVHSASAGAWTYFRVDLTPRAALPIVPKDVVILMDASGSIANDRLKSCRAAAKEILRTCLNTGDRFNLVAFRNDFDYAFRTWQDCTKTAFDKADKWLTSQTAHGRTDVFGTISSVLKLPRDPKRPLVALVVTDGDANEGVSRTSDILSKFTALNDGLISVYMYGVKEGANRELIDVLTHGNRGESFIYEGERKYAGRRIGELSDRFRDPVLTDLRVVFTSDTKADVYPRRLKNLYRGESVSLIGRAPAGTKQVKFSLKGLNGVHAYEAFFKVNLGQGGTDEFDADLPAAWRAEQQIDKKL